MLRDAKAGIWADLTKDGLSARKPRKCTKKNRLLNFEDATAYKIAYSGVMKIQNARICL